jgi:hypothetical protein
MSSASGCFSVTISSLLSLLDAGTQVDQLAVDLAGQRGLGQAGANRGGWWAVQGSNL